MIEVDFDPQRAELDALDEAFYHWLDNQDDLTDYEKSELARDFSGPDNDAPSFTMDDIYEGYHDIDEGMEVVNMVMEKNMQERINHKRQMIDRLNSGE